MKRVKLREDLLVEEVDGDRIVFDLKGSWYFSLNETGWLLWQRLREGLATVEDLGEVLLLSYEIDGAQARADAEEYVAHLIEAELASWEGE